MSRPVADGLWLRSLYLAGDIMGEQPMIAEKPDLAVWELKQLVKAGLYPDEQTALRSALRALFQTSPQAKIRMVINAYEAGDISLGKAAALLGVSQEEMKDILREAGSQIHLGPRSVEELLEDARNA